ncbi:CLUMA_CG011519, isoform A [Clunio marinus]|uniref:CLUMA_CG011519, isoform A n=1 Tax=Clunio marinus TaxID=568069 RepID=A0A1J1ICZ4_9DIPT|nr:CLUMA_CG011519, isoform A [Clunio marinus]
MKIPNLRYLMFIFEVCGSWFIQDLRVEVEVNVTTHSLLHLLTHINMKFSERKRDAKEMLGYKTNFMHFINAS